MFSAAHTHTRRLSAGICAAALLTAGCSTSPDVDAAPTVQEQAFTGAHAAPDTQPQHSNAYLMLAHVNHEMQQPLALAAGWIDSAANLDGDPHSEASENTAHGLTGFTARAYLLAMMGDAAVRHGIRSAPFSDAAAAADGAISHVTRSFDVPMTVRTAWVEHSAKLFDHLTALATGNQNRIDASRARLDASLESFAQTLSESTSGLLSAQDALGPARKELELTEQWMALLVAGDPGFHALAANRATMSQQTAVALAQLYSTIEGWEGDVSSSAATLRTALSSLFSNWTWQSALHAINRADGPTSPATLHAREVVDETVRRFTRDVLGQFDIDTNDTNTLALTLRRHNDLLMSLVDTQVAGQDTGAVREQLGRNALELTEQLLMMFGQDVDTPADHPEHDNVNAFIDGMMTMTAELTDAIAALADQHTR